MDWQKIWLLVDIIHKAQNVPNTNNILAAAMAELAEINYPAKANGARPEPVEPELDLKARRV